MDGGRVQGISTLKDSQEPDRLTAACFSPVSYGGKQIIAAVNFVLRDCAHDLIGLSATHTGYRHQFLHARRQNVDPSQTNTIRNRFSDQLFERFGRQFALVAP